MKRPTQLLLLFVLLAVAGLMTYGLWEGPAPTDLAPTDPVPGTDATADRQAGTPLDHREPVTGQDRRVELRPDLSGQDRAQGVKGTVANPQGYPVTGAKVYLMPTLGSNVFEQLKKKQQGMRFLPVAVTVTEHDGSFALGLEQPRETDRYEIRIVTQSFCERSVPAIQILEGDWFDAGTIRLKRGVVVSGRVTTKAGGFPIQDALVTIGNPNGVLRLAETPGQEHGLAAHTGAGGSYRIPNVNPVKSYQVSAVALDFARQERTNITLDPHRNTQVDFQLGPGYSITGLVTGPAGAPIRGAKVTAHALSQKLSQQEETRTDEQGRFALLGLEQGSFNVIAEAYGYVRGEAAPIRTGTKELHLVLEKQGLVIVQAFGKNGRPLRNYTMHLRPWFEGQPLPGPTQIHKEVRGAANGVATLEGINPMDYVVEVRAKDHAKAFSAPFRIVSGPQATPRVIVHLNEGGVIAGVVVDSQGNPLPGVAIQTLANHFVDNPLIRALGFQVPHRITKTRVVTNQQGEFRIPLLNDGKYQLKFTHRDHCSLFTKGHQVTAGQTTSLGSIRMVRGALVDGIARVGGVAKGQVRVTVSRIPDPNDKDAPPLTCDAVSNNTGQFVFAKRLLPGEYEGGAMPLNEGPFKGLICYQASKFRFRIGQGQIRHHLQVRIPR